MPQEWEMGRGLVWGGGGGGGQTPLWYLHSVAFH